VFGILDLSAMSVVMTGSHCFALAFRRPALFSIGTPMGRNARAGARSPESRRGVPRPGF
jgi:hypothetical protein